MREADKIMKELLRVKGEYQDLISERAKKLDECGVSYLKAENKTFVMQERRLFIQARSLQLELAEADPKNFMFSRENKSRHYNKKLKKVSQRGDNGYFLCMECKRMFRFADFGLTEDGHTTSWYNKDRFECCKDHIGNPDVGFVKLKEEAFNYGI